MKIENFSSEVSPGKSFKMLPMAASVENLARDSRTRLETGLTSAGSTRVFNAVTSQIAALYAATQPTSQQCQRPGIAGCYQPSFASKAKTATVQLGVGPLQLHFLYHILTDLIKTSPLSSHPLQGQPLQVVSEADKRGASAVGFTHRGLAAKGFALVNGRERGGVSRAKFWIRFQLPGTFQVVATRSRNIYTDCPTGLTARVVHNPIDGSYFLIQTDTGLRIDVIDDENISTPEELSRLWPRGPSTCPVIW
ncbi:hypothetical protein B0H10DRAFT_1960314 [Mycena sp. CBHHK59/15]|nr:hypothetical protein B0H10DRAFT_1960314 [Mycena sp. CBHHK59/15]